ncbi:MAG: GntP family permease [Planctomycetota bacterium]
MVVQLYELGVLLGGMALLTILVVQGRSIFVVAPLCALVTVTLSGGDPLAAMTGAYMTGFADFVRKFYLIVALGAVFGKLMEESGAAVSIADSIGRRLGAHRACLAVVLACAVLTYGGVSLFAVGFSVFPLAVQLFRQADLPRRFIPGAICLGSITFTMTSAGSPEIQNLIPIQYLVDAVTKAPLTDARAGWPVSLIVAPLMFLTGQVYLEWAIRRDQKAGHRWEARPSDRVVEAEPLGHGVEAARPSRGLPRLWRALLPLVVTVAALNLLPWVCGQLAVRCGRFLNAAGPWGERVQLVLEHIPEDATLSIFLGVVAALILLGSHLADGWKYLGEGFTNGFLAIGSTAAAVGFGAAVKDLPAFQRVVFWVTHLPVDPLLGAALAVAVIAAIAGSASGGQGIALPILKPIFVDELGVAPRALHRVVSIASGTLDSLPANGYVVMLIRVICGETHKRAYGPIFVTTVLIPIGGTLLAIGLFKLVPGWAEM